MTELKPNQRKLEWSRNFNERQQRLIQNAYAYTSCDPAGLPGHNLLIIIAQMVDLQLPSNTFRLEMLVTEPLKPFLTPALASLNAMGYMHQTTRGEFSGGTEVETMEPSNSLRCTLRLTRDMAAKFVRLFPGLAGVRLMRQWGGLVDMTADIAPVLGPVPAVNGFILDCGWVYGFMGAPAGGKFLAEYILSGQMPAEIAPFGLDRFETGKLVPDKSLLLKT